MADGNAQEVPGETRPGAPAEPIGVPTGRGSYQVVQPVSDLLGASARRMLQGLADGETNPVALAALADQKITRYTGTIVCCARRAHGPQTRVPTAPEDGTVAVATPRAADRSTGPRASHL